VRGDGPAIWLAETSVISVGMTLIVALRGGGVASPPTPRLLSRLYPNRALTRLFAAFSVGATAAPLLMIFVIAASMIVLT
jgi:hypothetical protein